MLKNRAQKAEKSQTLIQKWLHQSERILGEMPIGAALVVQTVFVMKKLAPSAPKVPKCAQERNMSQHV